MFFPQKVTQEEGQIVKLQTQVKKLESLLAGAKEEADKAQGKCSVQVSRELKKELVSTVNLLRFFLIS